MQGGVAAIDVMNLRHIEVFHAVYTNGSAVGAAQALHVSQPSISKMLRQTETRLGYPLFHRARGRLVPTDQGHLLFREVDMIYEQIVALRRKATKIGTDTNQNIRVAGLPSFGMEILPQAVARFRAINPRVQLDLKTLHTAGFLGALQDRTCDIAIGCEKPHHPQLACEEIGSSELVLLHLPGLIPDLPRVSLDFLKSLDFINIAAESGPLAQQFLQEINRQDLNLRSVVTVDTMYVAASLAMIGTGVTVVDRLTALAFRPRGLVHTKLDPTLNFSIYSIHLVDRPPSWNARSFIAELRRVLSAGNS
jgi:DNA-binding transcriptional LysR family regulator